MPTGLHPINSSGWISRLGKDAWLLLVGAEAYEEHSHLLRR